jgi:hypothetical protein
MTKYLFRDKNSLFLTENILIFMAKRMCLDQNHNNLNIGETKKST